MASRTTHEFSTDKRCIIKVIFERESPHADSPVVEVVFQLLFPEAFEIPPDAAKVLFFLTATRTDTRETIILTEEELRLVIQEAGDHAAAMDEDW